MKLTPEQIVFKKRFRELVIEYFWHPEFTMIFNVINTMAKELNTTTTEIYKQCEVIPSIGHIGWKTPIQAWLAQRYNPVAMAMYDKKPTKDVIALWSKTTMSFIPKRSRSDIAARKDSHKSINKVKAIAELHKNSADRWAKSDWGKVK